MIGVVTNPRSGKNRRKPGMAAQLAEVIGDRGEFAEPEDEQGLVQVAEHFRDRGVGMVAINGGDGTVHKVISAFSTVFGDKPLPPIALLCGGTMNTIARNMGIRASRPTRVLAGLVADRLAGRRFPMVECNSMRVDDQHLGFMFGHGLINGFMEVYDQGGTPGPWKAVRLFARSIASALVGGRFIRELIQPLQARIEVDGEAWPEDRFTAVAIGTVADVGLGFRPFHAMPQPDRLQVLGVTCGPWGMLRMIPWVCLGRPTGSPHARDPVARHIIIESPEPIHYILDGDLYIAGTTLKVEVGPRVSFVVP